MAALSQCGQLVSLARLGVVSFVAALRGLTLEDRAARPLKWVRETWKAARSVRKERGTSTLGVLSEQARLFRQYDLDQYAYYWYRLFEKHIPLPSAGYEYKRSSLEMDIRGSLPQSSSCSHSVKASADTAPRETHERTGNTDRHW